MPERLHEEINRRTRVAMRLPNEASLLRRVSAIEMEISEDWIAGKRYLNMNAERENAGESADSEEKRIYRKILQIQTYLLTGATVLQRGQRTLRPL